MNTPKSNKPAHSGRGGERENAGRPSQWNSKQTTAVRVPKIHLEAILEYARKIDSKTVSDTVQNQTGVSEQLIEIIDKWQTKTIGKETSPRWEKCSQLLQELQTIIAE